MRTFVLAAFLLLYLINGTPLFAQQKWINVDTAFGSLPKDFHVYKTTDDLDGKPFIAYYAEAKLKDKELDFTTDTTYRRRLTPANFFEKNNAPLLIVNTTFFSFETNQSLNVVIKDGKLLGYNIHAVPMKGKDTFQYRHPFVSAIGIDKKGNADVAWVFTDSSMKLAYAAQFEQTAKKDSVDHVDKDIIDSRFSLSGPFDGRYRAKDFKPVFEKWEMNTAAGGGPVLVQYGRVHITNEQELKFPGKAINDAHPRTCMGYTADGRLIIMVIQGRYPNAAGATLKQEAQLLVDLGCMEALNLDGGGSSCMLINGKETIKPGSDGVERPVPAVFIIKHR
jgi:hypothetical protein